MTPSPYNLRIGVFDALPVSLGFVAPRPRQNILARRFNLSSACALSELLAHEFVGPFHELLLGPGGYGYRL